MTEVASRPEAAQSKPKAPLRRQFVNFALYQLDSAWHRLSREAREESKEQLEKIINQFNDSKQAQILTFSTVGMRAEGDFLLWVIGYDLEVIQQLATQIAKSELGAYLTRSHSFLSMTKRSMYLDRFNPEHPEDRLHLIPGKYKYLFVYPFIKKRDWYLLPQAERQEMMDEHIRIGMKYQSVKLNTTYSFGLDDQEFVVAFETDEAGDFLDLVQELRESKASMYTLRDTPIITCIKMNTSQMLNALG